MSDIEQNRATAIKAMRALFEHHFDSADAYFHPEARWWIIGQGDMSHERVREIAHQTEGGHRSARLTILDTVAEGDKVCVEAVGDMILADSRPYRNSYHHVLEFRDGLIHRFREYFDTAYVQRTFGDGLYGPSTSSDGAEE
ncbi:MAG: nuclear transport factor 2 family protein [Pseudomonadota bacterium]|nr:nuclear transport factor 2 family protein [Pseudomonadota bacterium]